MKIIYQPSHPTRFLHSLDPIHRHLPIHLLKPHRNRWSHLYHPHLHPQHNTLTQWIQTVRLRMALGRGIGQELQDRTTPKIASWTQSTNGVTQRNLIPPWHLRLLLGCNRWIAKDYQASALAALQRQHPQRLQISRQALIPRKSRFRACRASY